MDKQWWKVALTALVVVAALGVTGAASADSGDNGMSSQYGDSWKYFQRYGSGYVPYAYSNRVVVAPPAVTYYGPIEYRYYYYRPYAYSYHPYSYTYIVPEIR